MNVKDASKIFKIDEKEIRNRKKAGMIIGCIKEKGRIVIPDETRIIPSKIEIQLFLLEILRYKNNTNVTISREFCPDSLRLEIILEYVYKRGFIGEYTFDSNIEVVFSRISLTEKGMQYLLGEGKINNMNNYNVLPVSINPQVKIGIVNT